VLRTGGGGGGNDGRKRGAALNSGWDGCRDESVGCRQEIRWWGRCVVWQSSPAWVPGGRKALTMGPTWQWKDGHRQAGLAKVGIQIF
jgi:hypothetical protein